MPNDDTAVPEPSITRLLFSDLRLAPVWFVIRVTVGSAWLTAGLDKLWRPEWTGMRAGAAVETFVRAALARTGGENPDVPAWYASFLQGVVLGHPSLFAHLVVYGEVLVGAALVLGFLTGLSAFCGGLLNTSFLFAGSVSLNPFLFILATWLVLGWRVSGEIGVDHWLLRWLGVPGAPGPWLPRWIRPGPKRVTA